MKKQLDFSDAIEEIKTLFRGSLMTQEELENEEGIAEVISREKGHQAAKLAMGGRVQVLRVLVTRKFHEKRKQMNEWEFQRRCEKYLDNILTRFDYRVEQAIDEVRSTVNVLYVSSVCDECGYMPTFCKCNVLHGTMDKEEICDGIVKPLA